MKSNSGQSLDLQQALASWNRNSFSELLDHDVDSVTPSITAYSWELCDKIFDSALSDTNPPIDDVYRTFRLVATHIRPRELYIILAEKAAGVISSRGSLYTELLLLGLLLCLEQEGLAPPSDENGISVTFLEDILVLARNVIQSAVSKPSHGPSTSGDSDDEGSNSSLQENLQRKPVTEAANCKVVELGLQFISRIVRVATAPPTVQLLIGFILHFVAHSVTSLSQAEDRHTAMERVIGILLGGSCPLQMAIYEILQLPNRVRHFITEGKKYIAVRNRTRRESSSDGQGKRKAEDVEGFVSSCTCNTWRSEVLELLELESTSKSSSSASASAESGLPPPPPLHSSNRDYDKNKVEELQMESLIAWDFVTDETAGKVVKELQKILSGGIGEGEDDDDDKPISSSSSSAIGKSGRSSLDSLRIQRILGILHKIIPTTGAHNPSAPTAIYSGSNKLNWTLTGAALIANTLLARMAESSASTLNDKITASLLTRDFDSIGEKNGNIVPSSATTTAALSFPKVFSPLYLRCLFYPHVYTLLRTAAVSTMEGLEYVSALSRLHLLTDNTIDGICSALGSLRMSCSHHSIASASAVYIPPSVLSISPSPNANSAFTSNGALEECSYDIHSANRVIRAVVDNYDASPRKAAKSTNTTSDTTANAADNTRPFLVLGAVCASSIDSLVLAQLMVNAMVSSEHESLRRAVYNRAFQEYLSQFPPNNRVCLLRQLIRDCPFASATGLLVDYIKRCCQEANRAQLSHSTQPHALRAPNATGSNRKAVIYTPSGKLPDELRLVPALHTPLSNTSYVIGDEGSAETCPEDADAVGLFFGVSPNATDTLSSPVSTVSAFLSPIVLRWFCLPPLSKMNATYTTEQILDNADEIGAAINLLQFIALKLSGWLRAADVEAVKSMKRFLGISGDLDVPNSGRNEDTNADAAVVTDDAGDGAISGAIKHLLASEIGELISGCAGTIQAKVERMRRSKSNKRRLRDDTEESQAAPASTAIDNSTSSTAVDGEQTVSSSQQQTLQLQLQHTQDALRMEVLLDNLHRVQAIIGDVN